MYIYKSMKEIYTDLNECAEGTGYAFAYLDMILEESIEDLKANGKLTAETISKAVREVIEISWEYDWDETPAESQIWKEKQAS